MRATIALRDAVHTPLIRFVGRRSVPRMAGLNLLLHSSRR